MRRSRFAPVVAVLVVALLVPTALRAGLMLPGGAVYRETFDANTDDYTIATLDAYPEFAGRFVVDGSAVVSGNQLWLINGTNDNNQLLVRPGVSGSMTVSALVGADNSNGSYNVGLRIGQNHIVFHPGYSGAALRVEGPGGFGNTNVGFTPANGVLHQLDVTGDGSGLFNFTLTDGANPANTFSASFTNAASAGGEIGLRRSGQPVGVGLFDDLVVNGSAETFDTNTDTGRSAVFQAALADGSVAVDSGQLVLASGGGSSDQHFLRSGLKRDHTIVAKVGASNSNGSYNVGLVVGENNIVFHPGYSGAALRVDGPGGFGNTNVGFLPANNVLHELRVKSDGTGNFEITLTDGANPANTFTTSFFNPGSVGGDFGLRRSGPANGTGLYDDLTVRIDGVAAVKTELFDRSGDMRLAYPGFREQAGGGTTFVSDGRLVLAPGPGGSDMFFTQPSPDGPYTVSTLVGSDLSNGSFNVGLQIGEDFVVFHPGYSGAALRVEGPGGFGNTNVGFTPANGVLHRLEVTSDGAGLFNITLTDGANPANTFSTSFTNPGSVGGPIGPLRRGPTIGLGLFDDFTVEGAVESFDTNTDAVALYPGFAATLNGGRAVVRNGVLELAPMRDSSTFQTFLTSGLQGEFEMTALVGASASSGNYNVGLTVGENNIVFHPGLAGGAFRVEGPGGFGNTNVGFTPDNGVLHLLRVKADGLGSFDVTLVDGADPSHVFTTSFFNPASVAGPMGFRRSGPTDGVGLFDNFIVTAVIPEPSTFVLAAVGLLCLALFRRTRHVAGLASARRR